MQCSTLGFIFLILHTSATSSSVWGSVISGTWPQGHPHLHFPVASIKSSKTTTLMNSGEYRYYKSTIYSNINLVNLINIKPKKNFLHTSVSTLSAIFPRMLFFRVKPSLRRPSSKEDALVEAEKTHNERFLHCIKEHLRLSNYTLIVRHDYWLIFQFYPFFLFP